MIKSILIIFILALFNTNKLYCQFNKNDSIWKSLFTNTFSNGKREAISKAEPSRLLSANYLIEIKKSTADSLFRQSNIEVKRQLDKQFYIVKAAENWISKNRNSLDYIAEANNYWKLSPSLIKDSMVMNSEKKSIFNITVNNVKSFDSSVKKYSSGISIISIFSEIKTFRIETTYSFIASHLLVLDDVIYIENSNRTPKEESIIGDFNNAVNTINLVHANYPNITGTGLVASVKENNFDTTDIDLSGRVTSTAISSNIVSSHATDMATIIAGGGNSFYSGLGSAWGAQISSADFKILLPDDALYKQYKISVQNHSYGVGIENFYGSDALAYDASMINNPFLLHIFSSGNAGDQSSSDGKYKGLTSFANLTGSFKMAKNIITVGSINSLGIIPLLSSKGPAYDGRVKPELVAYGESGSSEAAAIVSGIVLLLQDSYLKQHSDSLPDNMLVKAILINSADDVGNKGIDFSSGYGNVNAYRSIQNILAQHYFYGTVDQ